MFHRFRTLCTLVVAGAVMTACSTDATSPSPLDIEPTLAKGGSGGGGGGGGGGGTPKPGRILRASAPVSCDAGSTMSITIEKGFNDRGNIILVATASPTPAGPPVPPSTFPTTSLGGTWSVRIMDNDTGAQFMRFGTTMGPSTPSVTIQNLGGTVTPGAHSFAFTLVNLQTYGGTETCTATLNFSAK